MSTEMIAVVDGVATLNADAAQRIAELERQAKAVKKAQDDMKAALLTAMQRHNVIKIESDACDITYIAATDRETFDSKSFRRDCPDLYDEYVQISPVKASVRIKLK